MVSLNFSERGKDGRRRKAPFEHAGFAFLLYGGSFFPATNFFESRLDGILCRQSRAYAAGFAKKKQGILALE